MLDRHSPLSYAIVQCVNWDLSPHKGADTSMFNLCLAAFLLAAVQCVFSLVFALLLLALVGVLLVSALLGASSASGRTMANNGDGESGAAAPGASRRYEPCVSATSG